MIARTVTESKWTDWRNHFVCSSHRVDLSNDGRSLLTTLLCVDKFLNDEIFRASCDPCSLQVRGRPDIAHSASVARTSAISGVCRTFFQPRQWPLCAAQVMRSGVYLAPQRPLPFLLNQLYRGPVLILQGVLDPLNKARDRADVLEKRIHGSRKVLLEAGHCPHDEVPELVNDAIDEFIISDVLNDSSRGAAGAERAAVAV